MLKCSDGSFYVGHTDNIEKRISEHNIGKYSGYTSTRLPVSVEFVQPCASRDEARMAEAKIKKWVRRKKEALAEGGLEAVRNLRKKK